MDIESSNRRTIRSARNEALRSPEQEILDRVKLTSEDVKNARRAAANENVEKWKSRHNRILKDPIRIKDGNEINFELLNKNTKIQPVKPRAEQKFNASKNNGSRVRSPEAIKGKAKSIGKGIKVKGPAAIGLIIGTYSDYMSVRTANDVQSEAVFRDQDGYYVVDYPEHGIFEKPKYRKRYIGGDKEGEEVRITKESYLGHKDEAKALWGYRDWLGNFQPGLLNPELKEVEVQNRDNQHRPEA